MQPGERPPARLQGTGQAHHPERIDRMRRLRAWHTAQADKRDEASENLLRRLSPEQQKTFDAEIPPPGPGKHRGGRDHGGMYGHHHGPDGYGGRTRRPRTLIWRIPTPGAISAQQPAIRPDCGLFIVLAAACG